MNAVLVGGAGDGTWVVLHDTTTRYALVVRQKIDLRVDNVPEPLVQEIQHYNLFQLHPVTRAVIFAHEDLTPTQIMERVLESYSPKKEGLGAIVEEFVGWWELHREGSVNRTYDYIDKIVKRLREALP